MILKESFQKEIQRENDNFSKSMAIVLKNTEKISTELLESAEKNKEKISKSISEDLHKITSRHKVILGCGAIFDMLMYISMASTPILIILFVLTRFGIINI